MLIEIKARGLRALNVPIFCARVVHSHLKFSENNGMSNMLKLILVRVLF